MSVDVAGLLAEDTAEGDAFLEDDVSPDLAAEIVPDLEEALCPPL